MKRVFVFSLVIATSASYKDCSEAEYLHMQKEFATCRNNLTNSYYLQTQNVTLCSLLTDTLLNCAGVWDTCHNPDDIQRMKNQQIQRFLEYWGDEFQNKQSCEAVIEFRETSAEEQNEVAVECSADETVRLQTEFNRCSHSYSSSMYSEVHQTQSDPSRAASDVFDILCHGLRNISETCPKILKQCIAPSDIKAMDKANRNQMIDFFAGFVGESIDKFALDKCAQVSLAVNTTDVDTESEKTTTVAENVVETTVESIQETSTESIAEIHQDIIEEENLDDKVYKEEPSMLDTDIEVIISSADETGPVIGVDQQHLNPAIEDTPDAVKEEEDVETAADDDLIKELEEITETNDIRIFEDTLEGNDLGELEGNSTDEVESKDEENESMNENDKGFEKIEANEEYPNTGVTINIDSDDSSQDNQNVIDVSKDLSTIIKNQSSESEIKVEKEKKNELVDEETETKDSEVELVKDKKDIKESKSDKGKKENKDKVKSDQNVVKSKLNKSTASQSDLKCLPFILMTVILVNFS